MRLRPILWALAMVAGFVYLTSKADWSVKRIFQPIERTGRLWSAPQVAGALTTGVVRAGGRTIRGASTPYRNMIPTDAAITPGTSGGPLLDSHGSAIGINTMIYGTQGSIGIGFAMPINRARAILDEYSSLGRIARPMLGISVVYVSGDVAEALELPAAGGLLIQDVASGSTADEAGLR